MYWQCVGAIRGGAILTVPYCAIIQHWQSSACGGSSSPVMGHTLTDSHWVDNGLDHNAPCMRAGICNGNPVYHEAGDFHQSLHWWPTNGGCFKYCTHRPADCSLNMDFRQYHLAGKQAAANSQLNRQTLEQKLGGFCPHLCLSRL